VLHYISGNRLGVAEQKCFRVISRY